MPALPAIRPSRRAARPRLAVALALAVTAVAAACGTDAKTYPDTVDGLRALIEDAKAGADTAGVALPAPEAWYTATFGDVEATARLVDDMANRPRAATLGQALREQTARGLTEVLVERFDAADDPKATGLQSAALRRATRPLALYSVRLRPPGKPHDGIHFHSFAYVDGGFRWLGPLADLTPPPADPGREHQMAAVVAELRNFEREEFFRSGRTPKEVAEANAPPSREEIDAVIRDTAARR